MVSNVSFVIYSIQVFLDSISNLLFLPKYKSIIAIHKVRTSGKEVCHRCCSAHAQSPHLIVYLFLKGFYMHPNAINQITQHKVA